MPQPLHVKHHPVISLAEKYEEKNEGTGRLESWQGCISGIFISKYYLKNLSVCKTYWEPKGISRNREVLFMWNINCNARERGIIVYS